MDKQVLGIVVFRVICIILAIWHAIGSVGLFLILPATIEVGMSYFIWIIIWTDICLGALLALLAVDLLVHFRKEDLRGTGKMFAGSIVAGVLVHALSMAAFSEYGWTGILWQAMFGFSIGFQGSGAHKLFSGRKWIILLILYLLVVWPIIVRIGVAVAGLL